jgi:hypothetical protein
MMPRYEDALKEWGARKLEARGDIIDRASVVVTLTAASQGFACDTCGPDYEAQLEITGRTIPDGAYRYHEESNYQYDLGELLGEILAVSL